MNWVSTSRFQRQLRWTFGRGGGLLALLLPAIAWSQTGAMEATPAEYSAVPRWRPAPIGVGAAYRVDWREFLPEVGDQSPQNSCTGWAVAYALKSYHEARDQGWRPDAADRVFSPAFIYNQINEGVDRGSPYARAFALLQSQGCATLATMPYRRHDFSSPPSQAALAEAARFRITGYQALHSGADLRAALAEGNIVPVTVRLNPTFNSGRFEIFAGDLLAAGDAEDARQGAGLRLHAMCAVGYDDSRRAILLMNSWGKYWGQEGFCWISYDLLQEIAPRGANFMREAYVIFDERRKLRENNTPSVQMPPIAAGGNFWHSGIVEGRHTWNWQAHVVRSSEVADRIEQVIWKFAEGGQTREIASRDGRNGFEIVRSFSGRGQVEVTGEVRFKDGTATTVRHRFTFEPPAARARQLALRQTDRYFGRDSARQPFWEWTMQLAGDLVDLADVRQVTYHLHPTFPEPDRVVASGPESGFAFTTRGWGRFNVRATVEYKDGTRASLEKGLEFNDPVRDEMRLRNTSRYLGPDAGGQQRWGWTAFVDGPLASLREIERVTYRLHPTFNPQNREVSGGAEFGFPLSTTGWGRFLLRATVHYRNGATQELEHMLEFEGVAGEAAPPKR